MAGTASPHRLLAKRKVRGKMGRYTVRLHNLNNQIRSRQVPIEVQGHHSTVDDIGDTVWLHFEMDILRGGFHTDITSAEELHKRLGDAIKVARGETDYLALGY